MTHLFSFKVSLLPGSTASSVTFVATFSTTSTSEPHSFDLLSSAEDICQTCSYLSHHSSHYSYFSLVPEISSNLSLILVGDYSVSSVAQGHCF